MAYPEFYNPEKVGTLYIPDTTAAIAAGKSADIQAASEDSNRIVLLLIDAQVDFIHEDGALSVSGAVADTRRTIEWIFDNIGKITTIFASLDSHIPIQIFSPVWWLDSNGHHPEPFTLITYDEVRSGKWSAIYQPEWSIEYVERLEEQSKKQLMIWAYHTLIGTPGHSITPALYEAIAYHSSARQTSPRFIEKGKIPQTENYSIFEPEVKIDNVEDGGLDKPLLDELAKYDRIYVAGQAKSHCILESLTSMMRYFDGQAEIIAKIHVLEDAMSSVVSPDIDFETIANETLSKYAEQGLNMTLTAEAKI
jgi:nicotinamidase-related amidase